MGKITISTAISADKQQLTINLSEDGTPIAHAIFDAAGVQDFIHQLASGRAQMEEPVPAELDPGSRLRGLNDPRTLAFMADDGMPAIAVRDPGVGWLSFGYTPESARALGGALIALADETRSAAP